VTPLKDTKVTAQSTATLTCDIDLGEPKADIRWYRESRELYEGKKHSMSYSGNKAKLEINQSDLNDSAIYRVEADNRHGRVMSEAKLFVQGMIRRQQTSPVTCSSQDMCISRQYFEFEAAIVEFYGECWIWTFFCQLDFFSLVGIVVCCVLANIVFMGTC